MLCKIFIKMVNLLQSYSNGLRLCIGAVAFILYLIFVLKVLVLNCKLKEVLENPVVAIVLLTSTIATMLISTYAKPYSQSFANVICFCRIYEVFIQKRKLKFDFQKNLC